MATVYNRLTSKVAGKDIENEDFVNGINWHFMSFKIGDGEWFDINKTVILDISRSLDLSNGLLTRKLSVRDDLGRETRIESQRMVSMEMPHLAAVRYSVTPLNYASMITIKSGLYGDHINGGVERYSELNQHHLKPEAEGGDRNSQYLVVTTTQSGIKLAAAAKITVRLNDQEVHVDYRHHHSPERSEIEVGEEIARGITLSVDKIAALYKSTDHHHIDPLSGALDTIRSCSAFETIRDSSAGRWRALWDHIDIKLEGDRSSQKLLRLHSYHTMVTVSPHNASIDAGIPARGLHGEAYRGHIFWDELFILPFYFVHFNDAAREVLMYRYRRLDAARQYAVENGYAGAMFPWQSAGSGREETQVIHLNPVSGQWDPDYSSLQRHVSLAIAYNTWYYFEMTGDKEFMEKAGLELFFEICRFWASKCRLNTETGRYEIDKVMGPDEFHEKYRDAAEGGLKDNAYTNLMAAWMFKKAGILPAYFDSAAVKVVTDKMRLRLEEMALWQHISRHLNIIISEEGIISQYDGYFDLKELDWEAYRAKYGNIHRLDRILKAEGKTPDEFKVAKQADTLMTFYNLDKEEVDEILKDSGYILPEDYLIRNLNYYLARTSHGSTLSRVVHAHLANLLGDKKLSWSLYSGALGSDFGDIQGGTTAEGIHAGVMTATVWLAVSSYAGLNLRSGIVKINPCLPDHWRKIGFKFTFKGEDYHCIVSHNQIKIMITESSRAQVDIMVGDELMKIIPGQWYEMKLHKNKRFN
jgi:trehalose/maltose hydrolase-like predicted phosphorylase